LLDNDRLRPLSYLGTDVFLLVFSVVNPNSFYNVCHKWIPEARHHCPDVPIILCGSKIDLRDDPDMISQLKQRKQQVVTADEGEYMAWSCDCIGYVENSALTQRNLKHTFDSVVRCTGAWSTKRNELKKEKPKKPNSACKSQ
jgi:small GTP-binding protein